MMEFTTLPSLASLANRVRALRRKLYRPRHEVLLGRHVNQLCEEWADAQSQNKPLPDPHNFIRRVADSGFRFLPFTGTFGYLDYCRRRKKEPDHKLLLDALLPWRQSPCLS